jgi:hypothetical protein
LKVSGTAGLLLNNHQFSQIMAANGMSKLAQTVTLLICIWKVPTSNLG